MTPSLEPRERPGGAHKRGFVLAVLILVVMLLGGVAFLLRGAGDRLFFWPDAREHGTPESWGLDAERVSFAAPNGPQLDGWWAAAEGEARGTVVYCHGNHRNLTHHARFVAWLPARGFNLLLFDYRGYGGSEGAPSRAGCVADTTAAIDFALLRDPERTVLFGHSLGGAVGIVAAAERPAVRAIAVESTFPSYRAAARCTAPAVGFLVPWFVTDGLDPVDALPAIVSRPLLVVHGSADRITPVELGRALFAAAGEPKRLVVVDGGGHASPWVTQGRAFEDELCGFFAATLER